MSKQLFVATSDGVWRAERVGDTWQAQTHTLHGQHVTTVAASEGVILAGTTNGIFRSHDKGDNWQEASNGMTIPHVRWLAFHPNRSGHVLASTEPAGIFVSHDGGVHWRNCAEIKELREKHHWYLPYSFEQGCVRGFAFHRSRAYAAVEVGGLLHSTDYGEEWQLVEGSNGYPWKTLQAHEIHSDVHSIEVFPESPDLLFAPTGNGLYGSTDGGKTWRRLYPYCYCRAVWVDPTDKNHLILGPALAVSRQGRIEETHDGGESWQRAMLGIEPIWREHMIERFLQVDDELLAVLSNGKLLAAPLSTLEWQYILPNVAGVKAIAA